MDDRVAVIVDLAALERRCSSAVDLLDDETLARSLKKTSRALRRDLRLMVNSLPTEQQQSLAEAIEAKARAARDDQAAMKTLRKTLAADDTGSPGGRVPFSTDGAAAAEHDEDPGNEQDPRSDVEAAAADEEGSVDVVDARDGHDSRTSAAVRLLRRPARRMIST